MQHLSGERPRKRGPGKGEYGHGVPILSRPRRRFGYFAAVGKVTRRPQTAESPRGIHFIHEANHRKTVI